MIRPKATTPHLRRRPVQWAGVTIVGVLLAVAYAVLPPAASAQENNERVTVVANDSRIDGVIAMLNSQFEGSVNIYGQVPGERVTVLAEEVNIEDALNQIANPQGWVWWQEDDGVNYGLSDRDYFEQNILPKQVIEKTFRPNNVTASELESAIQNMLTPNVGRSIADDRTNQLIVEDLPQVLERIERLIRQMDVQLVIRVFYIRHANVEDVAAKIEQYSSGPGTIEVDVTTHQIIVTDLLSNIKMMELLIDILDVGPEIVIYDVTNIGIDGQDLEELAQIIDTIRTPELLFEINHRQGVFILEDVPEVHERVEQILASFDRPVKQVLIQGEILSTQFERTFGFGLRRFAIADDLFSAAQQGALGGEFDAIGEFTDIDAIFPNLTLAGDTITGNYLSNSVYMQYRATFEDSSTRVLLQPRLLVKNQQPSNIFVGEEVPFLTTFFDDRGDGIDGRRTTTQSTVRSGLTFQVTPSISNNHLIEMDLRIENDEARPQDIPDGGVTRRVVGRDRQNVETILQIPSGQTRMIGGLIRNRGSEGSTGVPFISSIPIIGSIFGSQTTSESSTNLMIFLTPTVVDDTDSIPYQPEDGRRGRLVTDYDRVAGAYDLGLDADDPFAYLEDYDFDPVDPEDLLSGSPEDEAQTLERYLELQRERQRALEDVGPGNYQPQAGFGHTTLGTPRQPSAPDRRSPAPPGEAPEPAPDGAAPVVPVEQPPDGQEQPPPPPPQTETPY